MNTVNWLAQQESLIAIRPKEAADRRLTMTAGATMIALTSHGGVTALVIGGMFQPAYQPFPPASFAYNTAFEHKGRDPKKPPFADGTHFGLRRSCSFNAWPVPAFVGL
mgnify:CR=1 FL=1